MSGLCVWERGVVREVSWPCVRERRDRGHPPLPRLHIIDRHGFVAPLSRSLSLDRVSSTSVVHASVCDLSRSRAEDLIEHQNPLSFLRMIHPSFERSAFLHFR